MSLIVTLVLIPAGLIPSSASPSIELSPEEGSSGTDVRVGGSGFDPLSTVTLTFDDDVIATNPASVMTDVTGRFEASFEVPESARPGDNTVTATSHGIITSNSASSTFTVDADNNGDPGQARPTEPVAYPQSLSTDEDEEKGIILQGSDDDGDTLTFKIVNGPSHGLLKGLNPSTGGITYHPIQDYSGKDTFTFKVTSGGDESSPATVSIHVTPINDAPTLDDVALKTEEDTKAKITLTAADIDSSSVHFYLTETPAHGQLSPVTLLGPYSIEVTYTPGENYNGTDIFKFKVNDKEKYSEIAEVGITITPANDAPVANPVEITTKENQRVSVSLIASDIDGDALSYIISSAPIHGILTGTAPNLEYVPSSNYHGYDDFSFKVTDGIAESNVATVRIMISETTTEPTTIAAPINPSASTGDGTPAGRDIEPPRLIVPSSPIKADTPSSLMGASVMYGVSAQDDRDGELVPLCSPASGSKFPVGRVNVVCSATDSAGNTAMESFVVEVELVDNSSQSPPALWSAIAAIILGFVAYVGLRATGRTELLFRLTSSIWASINRSSPFLYNWISKVMGILQS